MIEMREWTQEQISEDIKAIAEGREYDVKLPLRILKREQPKAYGNMYRKKYQEGYRKTDKSKVYRKVYNKVYNKALFELRKKHKKEFHRLLDKAKQEKINKLKEVKK